MNTTPGRSYESRDLPAPCQQPGACNDPECQRLIAASHRISEQEFLDRTVPPGAHDGKVISAREIRGLLAGVDCSLLHIAIDTNVPTNDDIRLDLVHSDIVTYSIAMFRGILQDDPDDFSFFKGVKANGDDDILFSVSFPDNPVRFYDLSDTET